MGCAQPEAAGMTTIAIPSHRFPPAAAALNQAPVVIESLQRLRPELPDRLRLARS